MMESPEARLVVAEMATGPRVLGLDRPPHLERSEMATMALALAVANNERPPVLWLLRVAPIPYEQIRARSCPEHPMGEVVARIAPGPSYADAARSSGDGDGTTTATNGSGHRSRGAVEREFGRLKHEWALLPLRVRGLDRVGCTPT